MDKRLRPKALYTFEEKKPMLINILQWCLKNKDKHPMFLKDIAFGAGIQNAGLVRTLIDTHLAPAIDPIGSNTYSVSERGIREKLRELEA